MAIFTKKEDSKGESMYHRKAEYVCVCTVVCTVQKAQLAASRPTAGVCQSVQSKKMQCLADGCRERVARGLICPAVAANPLKLERCVWAKSRNYCTVCPYSATLVSAKQTKISF